MKIRIVPLSEVLAHPHMSLAAEDYVDKRMSFAAEVIADSSGEYVGNGCRFATKPEAEQYARDLMGRWYAVREWRVVDSSDPVNYAWVDGRLESKAETTSVKG